MALVLGMDTGGTYTDGVIVDTISKKIVSKAKALTTKEDLTLGIEECISNLEREYLNEVQLVCLSTTLATNAIVEGKGSKTALIYMGYDDVEKIPAEIKVKVAGRNDVMGNEISRINDNEVRRVVNEIKDKVQAIVISGYASVRNPRQEKLVAQIVREESELPVVCAHQLTSALGFDHRTITAVLNARLINIINNLIIATKQVLCENGVLAPIMIVKGDGTLMTEHMAKEKPIETIMSGPAASVIGGLALTGKTEGIIMDMGGTTTDLAYVTKGKVQIKKEGARVGGWNTRVQAIEMSTFGIGGDSRICLGDRGRIHIGPQKVIPLCVAGKRFPNLENEIRSYRRKGDLKAYYDHEAECYLLNKKADLTDLNEEELEIAEIIRDKAHSMAFIGTKINKDPEVIRIGHLADKGIFIRIGFTPTDLLHVTGKYDRWDRKVSYKGIEVLAARLEWPVTKLIKELEKDIKKKLAMTAVQSTYDFAGKEMTAEESKEAMHLIDRAFNLENDTLLDVKLTLKKPLIALGAPAQAWLKTIEKHVNADITVPENADVANAYGAAVGQLIETVKMEILVDGAKLVLNTPWERFEYRSKEEAMFYAIHEGRKHIEHLFMDAGCSKWDIKEEAKDKLIEIDDDHNLKYIGTTVTITGTAKSI